MITGFDIETAGADKIFKGGHHGPFVRLVGWVTDDEEPETSDDPSDLLRVLEESQIIYGHNILGFDLVALAVHCGADYRRLAAKSIDTLVVERTLNPPYPKIRPGVALNMQALRRHGLTPADLRIDYSLGGLARRYGAPAKSGLLDILAAQYGGYDRIPLDHPKYRRYLCGDLLTSRHVYRRLGREAQRRGLLGVVRREMRIEAIKNRMYVKGMGVDRAEVEAQVKLAEEQRRKAYLLLHEKAGVPLPNSEVHWAEKVEIRIPRTTKRGKRIRSLYENLFGVPCPDLREGIRWRTKFIGPSALTSVEGRAAFERALLDAGVRSEDVPFTLKGALALSKQALGNGAWLRGKESVPGLMSKYPDNPAVRELCEAAIKVTSANAKAEEVLKNICPDGRVHPRIGDNQASGRWAHIEPSVTNTGKRGEALEQRAMFRAKEGHVFIAIDLDQVDARAIAGWCQDPEFKKLAAPGMDMHFEVALRVYGPGACDDCRQCAACAERRANTKAPFHAWNYGQSPQGASALTRLPIEITERFDAGMKEAFSVLCSWRERIRDQARRTGFVPSKWGRPLRVIPGQEYTQAPAQVGQSTTRDLLCDGLLRMDEETLDTLCLVVHDEIVLEVPEDRVEEFAERAMAALTATFEGVSITCGASPAAKNWIGCYEKK